MEQGDTGLSEASKYYGISTNRRWISDYFRISISRIFEHGVHRFYFNQDIGPFYDT
jgi:hypothetical protein